VTDINTATMTHETAGKPDVIIAMFLFQDMPDLEGVPRMVNACLRLFRHDS
jgi:hypothetical protein